MSGDLMFYDIQLFRAINTGMRSSFLDLVMSVLTEIGSGEFLIPMAFVLLLLSGRLWKAASIYLLAGQSACYFVVKILKELIGRPRPFLSLTGVNAIFLPGGASFPSNHTATAFMAAYVLGRYTGRPILFYSLASLVGFSRVYLGVHYPLDVLAGSLVGIFIGHVIFVLGRGAIGKDRGPQIS